MVVELLIAIPNKGRVQEDCIKLLDQIGLAPKMRPSERRLMIPTRDKDITVVLGRSGDIPLMLEGKVDIGITGEDMVAERSLVRNGDGPLGPMRLLELDFGRCRVSLAGPPETKELRRIATALPNIATDFCRRNHSGAKIIQMGGSLEIAPRLGIADAIIDQVDTGTTLVENHLVEMSMIMESSICLYGNPSLIHPNRDSVDHIIMLIQGIMDGRRRVLLKMNAASPEVLARLLEVIPAMKSPDISPLANDGQFSLTAAVPRKDVEDLIRKIKANGGGDILVMEAKYIIP